MTPKMGRPKSENPRDKKIGLRLTEEELKIVEEAREKSKDPGGSLSTWVTQKIVSMAKKIVGKK